MAARDSMSASPGGRGEATRKTRIRISHTSGQKLVFIKGHDPNNVSIEK